MTLAELNEWLYLEIAGQYHHDIHRMIGTTPAAAWAKSLARGTVPVLPSDPTRFVIGEADLPAEQHAYRPGRNALTAVGQVHSLLNTGHTQVIDADLAAYFDTIPHFELLKSVARRVCDRHMLHGLGGSIFTDDSRATVTEPGIDTGAKKIEANKTI